MLSVSPVLNRFCPHLLALLSGSLIALSFPRTELYLLAWIAFVPLFFAIQNQSLPRAFFFGWLAGVAYFLGTLSWVTISMENYGGVPRVVSVLLMLLLVSYMALYVGLFSFFIRYIEGTNEKGLLLLAPSIWVTLELIKAHLLSGFPWASLAYSQYHFLEMVQIADIGSIYIVAFVIILFNRATYRVIRAQKLNQGFAWKELSIGLSVLLLTYSYGLVRLSQPMSESEPIAVSVIQGNIAQDQKWDPAFREKTLQIYKRLTLSTLKKVKETPSTKSSLIVWPEASVPFIYENEPMVQRDFLSLVQEGPFDLLFGAPAIKMEESGKLSLLNSAYLVSSSTKHFSRYDKMHLVPFGEYVPFSTVLFFIEKLVTGIGDFVPGEKVVVMETGDAQLGTVICFEVIFPDLVREFVKEGANLMTTITNDAWFGRSAAPFQHFAMVAFRAIENRVPFARAANTGISGFIDAHGRITHTSAIFVEAAVTAQLHPGYRKTLYTTYGDFFAVFCSLITLIFLVQSRIKNKPVSENKPISKRGKKHVL